VTDHAERLRATLASGYEPDGDYRRLREAFARLGAEGFYRACFAHQDPSRGCRLHWPAFATLVGELATGSDFGLTLCVALHVGVFVPLVWDLASPEARARVLDDALDGRVAGAIAATDAGVSGSDLPGTRTTVVFGESGLEVTGAKEYIAHVPGADYAALLARWRDGRHFANFCALLVPLAGEGISVEELPMAVMRPAPVGRIRLDRARLPADLLLGRRGLGLRHFVDYIAHERLAGGVWAAAVLERCLADARRAAAARTVGEASLWENPAVRQRLARAVVSCRLLRSAVDAAIDRACDGRPRALDCNVVKAAAPGVAEEVVGACLQLEGARGLERGSALLRLLVEFRTFGVGGGATETALEAVAASWPERA
jgi:alkylation response protein AidB-like acyl-CoA dehydrogenase